MRLSGRDAGYFSGADVTSRSVGYTRCGALTRRALRGRYSLVGPSARHCSGRVGCCSATTRQRFMAVSPIVRSLGGQWPPIEWVMQVGGYRPQFRPHRIAISLNFNQHFPRERAPCLEDRKPMRSHREDRAVNDRLSWRWLVLPVGD